MTVQPGYKVRAQITDGGEQSSFYLPTPRAAFQSILPQMLTGNSSLIDIPWICICKDSM